MLGTPDQTPTLYSEDSEFGFEEAERLVAIRFEPRPPEERTPPAVQVVEPSSDPEGAGGDPGQVNLVVHLAPNNIELHNPAANLIGPRAVDRDTAMTDYTEDTEANPETRDTGDDEVPQQSRQPDLEEANGTSLDAGELREKAHAGLQQSEAATQPQEGAPEDIVEKRHDSHQEQEPPLSPSKQRPTSHRDSPSLKVERRRESNPEESICTSPTLSKHVRTQPKDTLPAFQHQSPSKESGVGSPQNATLPPIRQVVPNQELRPLDELAEVASQAQQDSRYPHQHRPSFGSTTSQSPILPYHPYPGSTQMSPSAYSARTPISAFGDPYGSPTHHQPVAYYNERRSSAPTGNAPHLPPSLPSVSSSGDSRGHASSIDGYSTTHTTPSDVPDAIHSSRQLPPIPGMGIPAGFKCDVDGCNVPPFHTQYLLTFVHSRFHPPSTLLTSF